jgi:hypothetical protein
MSGKAAARPAPAAQSGTIRDHHRTPGQMELFGNAHGATSHAPTWPDLPRETRRTLTELMARLLLDHTDRNVVSSVAEIHHDL